MKKIKLMFDDYYKAVEVGFKRIWQSKAIWFWGLFIGSGMSFNLGGGGEDEELVLENELVIKEFLVNNWQLIVAGVLVLIVFCLSMWVISGIARVGVIKELNKKQKKDSYKLRFGEVWNVGIKGFKKVLMMDLFVLGIVLPVIAIGGGLVYLIFFTENTFLMMSVSALVGILMVGVIFAVIILRPFAQILLILSNLSIRESFKRSWEMIKANWREFFKLVLTLIVLGLIMELVFVLVALAGGVLGGLLIAVSTMVLPVAIVLGFVLGLIFILFIIAFVAFRDLWQTDIIIWWVNTLNKDSLGNKIIAKVKKIVKKKKA